MGRIRNGWTRLEGGVFAAYRHDATGWHVYRCGHPTALWPYYGVPPGLPRTVGPSQMLLAGGIGLGTAFRTLVLAQTAVEEMVAKAKAETK